MMERCCTATLTTAASPRRIWRHSPRCGRPTVAGSGAADCSHRQQLLRLPHGTQVADAPAGGGAAHAAALPPLSMLPAEPSAVMSSQRYIFRGGVDT